MEIKRRKRYEKVCHKKKLKFKNYKNCQKAIYFENEINHLQKMILK